jgi:hypothetical protein
MTQIDITKKRKGMFLDALAKAKCGDEILYHVGEYAAGWHKRDALEAEMAGRCFLYQRRLGDRQFAYIACKRRGKK